MTDPAILWLLVPVAVLIGAAIWGRWVWSTPDDLYVYSAYYDASSAEARRRNDEATMVAVLAATTTTTHCC